MQTDDTYGKVRPRKPSFRGHAYAYVSGGEVRVAAWPTHRRKGHRSELSDTEEWFRQAQWASKYWPAQMQVQCAEAVKGTPLMPRDIMTMIMAGRAFMWVSEDGWKVYSVAARNDVSESLDVLSQYPGSILYRGTTVWEATIAPARNYILVSNDPGEGPEWKPLTGSGGIQNWTVNKHWDFAIDGAVSAVVSDPLDGAAEALVVIDLVTTSASVQRVVQISTDGGLTWWNTTGDYSEYGPTGIVANNNAFFTHTTATAAARSTALQLLNIGSSLSPKVATLINRGVGARFSATPALPTHLRVFGSQSSGPNPTGTLTGGTVTIYTR